MALSVSTPTPLLLPASPDGLSQSPPRFDDGHSDDLMDQDSLHNTTDTTQIILDNLDRHYEETMLSDFGVSEAHSGEEARDWAQGYREQHAWMLLLHHRIGAHTIARQEEQQEEDCEPDWGSDSEDVNDINDNANGPSAVTHHNDATTPSQPAAAEQEEPEIVLIPQQFDSECSSSEEEDEDSDDDCAMEHGSDSDYLESELASTTHRATSALPTGRLLFPPSTPVNVAMPTLLTPTSPLTPLKPTPKARSTDDPSRSRPLAPESPSPAQSRKRQKRIPSQEFTFQFQAPGVRRAAARAIPVLDRYASEASADDDKESDWDSDSDSDCESDFGSSRRSAGTKRKRATPKGRRHGGQESSENANVPLGDVLGAEKLEPSLCGSSDSTASAGGPVFVQGSSSGTTARERRPLGDSQAGNAQGHPLGITGEPRVVGKSSDPQQKLKARLDAMRACVGTPDRVIEYWFKETMPFETTPLKEPILAFVMRTFTSSDGMSVKHGMCMLGTDCSERNDKATGKVTIGPQQTYGNNAKVDVSRHILTHMPKQFRCPICNYTFSRVDSFKRHVLPSKAHPDQDAKVLQKSVREQNNYVQKEVREKLSAQKVPHSRLHSYALPKLA